MKTARVMVIVAAVLLTAGVAAANTELKLSQPLSAKFKEATCLHENPQEDAPAIICFTAGAEVTLVARMQDKESSGDDEGYWYKAEVPGGAVGWVFSTFLEIAPADGGDAAGGEGDAGGGK